MAARIAAFEIFKAKNRQFAWRLRGRNGVIVATAHETFTRRRDAARACHRLKRLLYKPLLLPIEYV